MTLMAALLAAPMWAQVTPLGGFYYGQMPAPTGWEWQSPDSVAYNKQQPHAWFFSFENVEQARKVLPENSPLAEPRRPVAVPLGQKSRRTPKGLLQDRLRRFGVGQNTSAHVVEHGRQTSQWHL